MLLTTRVKLVLDEAPETGLPGVRISLYDRDLFDEDDLLGEGLTDAGGQVFFSFDSARYTDAEDKDLWRIDSLPDLYVVVYDTAGKALLTTRTEALQDQLPRLITIPIPRLLAQSSGLLAK